MDREVVVACELVKSGMMRIVAGLCCLIEVRCCQGRLWF
jgi:hypothetical protein